MTAIKYDFNSCYDAYDFSYVDYEEIHPDFEPTLLEETCEDILNSLLIQCEIELCKPRVVVFPDPIKLLTNCKNKIQKTLSITPKSIFFNKKKNG